MASNKKDILSKIEMVGRLLTKEIDSKNVVILSEEVTICVLNLSTDKKFQYSLFLSNNDKNNEQNSSWDKLSFEVKPSMNLSYFINNDVECFQWSTEKNIYFFEILLDSKNERNRKNFMVVLEQCLYSLNNNVPANISALKVKKISKKYIINLGIIEDLGKHVDEELKKLKEQIEKNKMEKELLEEMRKLELAPKKKRKCY